MLRHVCVLVMFADSIVATSPCVDRDHDRNQACPRVSREIGDEAGPACAVATVVIRVLLISRLILRRAPR